ncbi:hypothetical protein H5410_010083 [Solanum commersonii]|uniref:Zinc finger PMZ-type domain-containing protein n=1 Tax=Solanum commersonii TaxID=4109 RepID=A0A9J6AKB2_SOLCO|nr:hypothetical protein H5410_010083 [Solanum commersonii]
MGVSSLMRTSDCSTNQFFANERLPKMVLVDLVFHYGGKWIREPKLLYERKLVHKWEGYDSDLLSYIDITNEYINILGYVGVQQLLVSVPSGKYYEIEGDEGIRTLLSFVNDKFDVINLFVVDVENIIKMLETVVVIDDVSTDCTSDGTENDSDTFNDNSDYNSEELEVLALERRRVIDGSLCDYKDLHKSMTFKDIAEARRYISLHSLANGYNLTTKKSDRKKLRVVCRDKYNFVCLISGEKHIAGVRVKTLKGEHNKACKDPCGNYKVSVTTMAFYFKEKLQANPKYKIKEMRVDMKTAFNINAHFEKCKRAKRMILEDMEGSFVMIIRKLLAIEMYNEFLKIANVCELNFNGDDGFEVSEENDRHIVNLAAKKCTYRVWVLTGIPCPHSIKALLYKSLDPLEEIHWWYSKKAYLLTYHCKLQPVPGQKFWKIEAEQAMEPLELFNQNSEEGTSNTGQVKSKKKKMDKQCDKGKKQTNERHKTQPTQDCASDENEDEDFDLDVGDDMPWKPRDFSAKGPTWKGNAPETENMLEQLRKEKDDMPWKPRDFSELNSRIQQRQNQARPTGSRRINFLGDGLSVPSDLYAPKGLT